MYIKTDNMKTTRKTAVFFLLAFAFVIGCQGQYPESQAVDTGQCTTVNTVQDSAVLVIYYQPLTSGIRWKVGGEYKANPEKFHRWKNVKFYSGGKYTEARLDAFTKEYIERMMYTNNVPCGFYKVNLSYSGNSVFMGSFTKCNPHYIGRNDYGVDPDAGRKNDLPLLGAN